MTETPEETAERRAKSTPAPPAHLSDLRVTRTDDGRYRATWAGQDCIVQISACFPWSAPGAFVSLRDEEDHEVAFVPSLDAVDVASRAVLERALREAAFAFQITHVASVRKEFEIRHWEVTCVEGQRAFQTKVDDYPSHLPPHGLLITDVAGDVYVIHDCTTLNKHSRKQLAMFID